MNKIKVKNTEQFQECVEEDCEEGYFLEFVEAGEWTQDYKRQHRDIILRRKRDNTFWSYSESRTGSPFTDWHYDSYGVEKVTLVQVKQVEVTVTKWEGV